MSISFNYSLMKTPRATLIKFLCLHSPAKLIHTNNRNHWVVSLGFNFPFNTFTCADASWCRVGLHPDKPWKLGAYCNWEGQQPSGTTHLKRADFTSQWLSPRYSSYTEESTPRCGPGTHKAGPMSRRYDLRNTNRPHLTNISSPRDIPGILILRDKTERPF